MSDDRGRSSYSQDDRSTRRTLPRAPSRSRREPSRDRSRTSSLNSGPGPDNGRNSRYYPPPAGSRSGSGASSHQFPLPRQGPAIPSDYLSALNLPVYVGYSQTTSQASLLGRPNSTGPVSLPRRDPISIPHSGSRHELGSTAPLPHDLPPSRPPSSNPARPLTDLGGSAKCSDPTAPGLSNPGPPSWAQGSTAQPFTTVSNYPDHGHTPASQSPSLSSRTGSIRSQLPLRRRPPLTLSSSAPDHLDNHYSGSTSSKPPKPYTRDHRRAGYNSLPSELPHPGEIVVPSDSSGLSQAQSRSSDHSIRAPRTASPYVQAARVERRHTEQRSRLGGWPARARVIRRSGWITRRLRTRGSLRWRAGLFTNGRRRRIIPKEWREISRGRVHMRPMLSRWKRIERLMKSG